MAVATTALLVGGAVAAAGVAESRKARKAAERAGRGQEAAAQSGQQEISRQFDITQENLAPFLQTGQDALNQQRILLGLGSLPPEEVQAAVGAGQPLTPDQSTPTELPGQTSKIASAVRGATGFGFGRSGGDPNSPAGIALRNKIGSGARPIAVEEATATPPGIQPGVTIDNATQQVIPTEPQLTPEEEQQQLFDRLSQSPGQQFIRKRQERALLRNASAIGGLGGGNVRTALQEQGTNFALQDIQNQFGRLGQLAGQGAAAGTNIGQFGAQSAGAGAQLGIQGAQARASGDLASQQIRGQGIGQIANIVGQFAGGGFGGGGGGTPNAPVIPPSVGPGQFFT